MEYFQCKDENEWMLKCNYISAILKPSSRLYGSINVKLAAYNFLVIRTPVKDFVKQLRILPIEGSKLKEGKE